METTLLTEAKAKREIIRLIRESDRVDVAVAWAGQNEIVTALARQHRKLRHVVIGTHLYQTDPRALRVFQPCPAVKCMAPNGRLFHPKVYLFHLENAVAAIIGSHNLTAGAFDGGNTEASVLLVGSGDEKAIKDLVAFVKSKWLEAGRIDEDFLFSYEAQYKINREKRKALSHFHRMKKPPPNELVAIPSEMTWADFVRKIRGDEHGFDARLQLLERAAALFTERVHFANMEREERRAIAGTYGSKEATLDGLPWGWFGTMFGQGDFRSVVNRTPERLSGALDHIPLDGEVSEECYKAFAKAFRSAFRDKAHKGGVPTASRLLMMKRPDVFVGVNSANRKELCAAYGVASSTIAIDNYWERIVIPTQLSPWWQQQRPRTHELGRIWDNRAALIDCIYYHPE